MTCGWSVIIVDFFMCCEIVVCSVFICLFVEYFQPCLFSAAEIVTADADGTNNRHQKMKSIYGVSFWSVCHGPSSKVQ